MKTKQKIVPQICLILALVLILSAVAYVGVSVYAASSSGELFDYSASTARLKYKTVQGDVSDPAKKGLLLYAYDSGAFADFKANLNGSFSADLKTVKRGSSADLSKYSLVFTDIATGKSFSVIVENKGSYCNVCVSVDGNKAGIYYYTTQYDVNGTAYGYTALYNNSEVYTNVASDEVQLEFNPATMQVNVLGNAGAYHPVWDFSTEYNDGKRLEHDLPQFGEYTVRIVFDEVKSNGKGELLVYSFGGYTFESAYAEDMLSLYASVTANAVVGQEYSVPQASITDLISGSVSADDVSVSVYDVNGNILNDGKYTFTPTAEGDYFIYYCYKKSVNEEPAAVAFYKITAFDEADCSYSFTYDNDLGSLGKIGINKSVYISKGSVESNLFVARNASATVTIKKDGTPVDGYENIASGFTYTFTDEGNYSIIYQVNVNGKTLTDEKTVTVSAEIPTYIVDEVPSEARFLSTLNLTAGKVYVNHSVYDMDVTLTYPSGKTVKAGEHVLDELGTYVISNKYNDTVQTQEIVVSQLYSELFTGDFTSAQYGTLVGNNTVSGQIVTLTNGNSVTYSKVIDLSAISFNEGLDDKSQNTPLLEMYAQPHSLNVADLQTLYITLTDKYDSNNYIIVRVNYLSYLPNNMRIRAMAAGQGWVGYDYEFYTGEISVDSAQGHDDGGTIVDFNCTQSANGRNFLDRKLRLYFDNETGRLYTKTWQETTHMENKSDDFSIPWLIRDFKTTDPTLSAGDTPWKGFTTGEVYLSIYATGINDTADLLITNINGEDLTGKYYVDDVAPIITIDVDENDVPFAQVGKDFKVFDHSATDGYSFVAKDTVRVIHGGKDVELNNGVFKPHEVGDYTIEYTATDAFGNVATKSIVVEAKNSFATLSINIDGTIGDIPYGQLVQLPSVTVLGGAGGVVTNVKVTAVDANKDVEIKNDTFRALYAGLYRVEYTAKDYIGTSASKSLWVNVAFSAAPIFDEKNIVLPSAFIADEAYQFSDYFATYYNGNGGSEQIKAVITVTDADGERVLTDGNFVPVASEENSVAIITISFSVNGQSTSVVREVPILTINGGLGYLKNYFATNGTIDAVNDALIFAPNDAESMQVAFANAISQRYLTIGMRRENVDSFTKMDILLRDISDSDATVKLTYRNNYGALTLSINDGAEFKANFDTKGNFAIKYDNASKRIFDVLGMEIATITTYQDGSDFNGFPSGMAYFEIETDGRFALTSIANQNFNNYFTDSITPLLTINGSFSGTYVPGQTITLPSATAYDVLSATSEITVVIKTADGNVVLSGTANKALTFVPQDYGTYSVVYSVTDASDNIMTYSSSIVVIDNVKPSLTFNGTIPETAKVGTSLTLPKYTITDNGDITKVVVKNYVCGPDGIMIPVASDGTVKLNARGTYIVYYFVVDGNDNAVNYTFTITVS